MKYEFRFISSLHFIGVFLLTVLMIAFVAVNLFGPFDKAVAIIFTISTLLLSYFTASISSKGKILLTMNHNEIGFQFLSKPLISFKKDIYLSFDDIESWRYRPDRNFDLFKIKKNGGEKIRFERSSSWTKDSDLFDKFLRQFKKSVEVENRNRTERQVALIIDNEIEFFKSAYAKFMYYFLILILVFSIIILVITWDSNKSTPFHLIAAACGGLFYIFKYKQMNNQK